jgi:hypothetical protein
MQEKCKAGDILVIAICFVIGILVATSYNTRKEIPSGALDVSL